MTKVAFPYVAAGVLAPWFGFLSGCSPVAHDEAPNARALPVAELVGRWQYDSAGACIYNAQGRVLNCFMDPLPSGAVLTVGAERWTYSGSLREEHGYAWTGRTLRVWRVVDSALVRQHHAPPQELGQIVGRPDTQVIAQLTPRRLVVVDSATDEDGSITRVWRYYYSR
jgi:hypothetical protein